MLSDGAAPGADELNEPTAFGHADRMASSIGDNEAGGIEVVRRNRATLAVKVVR